MFLYYKCYSSIELTFLKELILTKQKHQKSVIIVTIGIKGFKLQLNVCNRCHDLLMSVNLSDTATLNTESANYRCIKSRLSKNEAINLMQNADLNKKSRTSQNITYYHI